MCPRSSSSRWLHGIVGPSGETLYFREEPEHIYYKWGVPGVDDIRKDHPLLSRGWAYQERLLSRRTIHFTKGELQWECYQAFWCECDPLGTRIGSGACKGGVISPPSPALQGPSRGHVRARISAGILPDCGRTTSRPTLCGQPKLMPQKSHGQFHIQPRRGLGHAVRVRCCSIPRKSAGTTAPGAQVSPFKVPISPTWDPTGTAVFSRASYVSQPMLLLARLTTSFHLVVSWIKEGSLFILRRT